jgi:pyruvate dehydrogenase E2 component (dihydrolipoamide acetyltransferase)
MEALSPTMEEGQLVRWLKSEGDSVSNGEILAEIETDKATMELVARGAGILRKVLLGEGGTAPVGEVIAVIAARDEDIGDVVGATEPEAAAPLEQLPVKGEDSTSAESADSGQVLSQADGGDRIKASPLARRLADDAHLDLKTVPGSGPGGRIVVRDVEAARSGAGAMTSLSPAPGGMGTSWSGGPEVDFEDLPLSQMRKTIAKRLVESLGPVPHFFLGITVEMSRTLAARKRVNGFLEAQGEKVSINDFILKATAGALERHPEANAQWTGEAIRRHYRVHLGVAVAVDDGLITPVIRDANKKGLAHISREIRELAARGREKKLHPDEYTGSTFSVSNLGMFGIHEFTGVINPPEAGILAVGGIEETPVVEDGQVVVRPLMKVTMSCDHRVIDGATGARFLQTLKEMLEEPVAILV